MGRLMPTEQGSREGGSWEGDLCLVTIAVLPSTTLATRTLRDLETKTGFNAITVG